LKVNKFFFLKTK